MSQKNLLIACYELGHQPLSLAWPLAALKNEGLDSEICDLSVDKLPLNLVKEAEFIGIAVPMHTALRIGVETAKQIREINPKAHICFYGHYSWLNADFLLESLADSVIAGEYEKPLIDLMGSIIEKDKIDLIPGVSTASSRNRPNIKRINFQIPNRSKLPALDKYAHYSYEGSYQLVGYVETSRGCLHSCTHCPLVPIYQGRFFVIPLEIVWADIRQQVEMGAKHISFGDPDFLNGPKHAKKLVRQLHEDFPEISFSFTTKIEHILKHKELIEEFSRSGCSFIITACEATKESVLERLNKGHTISDMEDALNFLQEVGIAPQPTWMPFTPWTSLEDYLFFLSWIREQNLIPFVPAVQLAVRMLVPPGSLLLNHSDVSSWCGDLDQENFTYRWDHSDLRMDQLQAIINNIAELNQDSTAFEVFKLIEDAAYSMAGEPAPDWVIPSVEIPAPPKMTENWFC